MTCPYHSLNTIPAFCTCLNGAAHLLKPDSQCLLCGGTGVNLTVCCEEHYLAAEQKAKLIDNNQDGEP